MNSFERELTRKDQYIVSAIDEIEAEMKLIGYWHDDPPQFEIGHYLEAPSFELWLQCVFIPNVRKAAETGSYPSGSQVGQMAFREYNYHSHVEQAQYLLELLQKFDRLVVDQ